MTELKNKNQWVCWKREERKSDNGKTELTKIPKNPRTGRNAQSSNPYTWADFITAEKQSANYDGLGFMFADGICGIDIDNKTNNPDLEKHAQEIINFFDTYTEHSPSGTGFHIIFKCDISKIPTKDGKLDNKYYSKNPHNDLECYFSGLTNRFFTYTAEAVNNRDIEDRTEQVLQFLENYMVRDNFKNKKESISPQTENNFQPPSDFLEKARKAKNGHKFMALFDRGETHDYNNDDSAADLALCNMLAWWLQGDFNQIDYYFRRSRLYRDKWNREDYRTQTINNAIASCGGEYYNPPGRPKKENPNSPDGRTQLEMISIEKVAEFLEQNGITVKYNRMTRDVDINGAIEKYDREHINNSLPLDIYDQLKFNYKKCLKTDVYDYFRYIAASNSFNPVLELIESGSWDKVDRMPELYKIMRIDDDDSLSKILIYKWVWQNLSMARNEKGEYGSDGLLVLQGGQGIGKTTFARKMALKDEFFGEGLHVDNSSSDIIRRATSVWIGELGEIESTFKHDISALKAFITMKMDKYRLPYAHSDEKLSRRTSFIGTCNNEQYLIDETGNRRFWTVPIPEKMDLTALSSFNAYQLYLQIYEQDAKNNIQGFRLSDSEQKSLAERNGKFEKPLKGEIEVRDVYQMLLSQNRYIEKEVTITEWKAPHKQLDKYSAEQVGKVLGKMGIEQKTTRIDGEKKRLRKLPMIALDFEIQNKT